MIFRGIALLILTLIPLVTLFHRDAQGRWEVQHSAMSCPDEFSYLLMARDYLHTDGPSLHSILGRDTFYPPGYPLLLAVWGQCFGLTAFTAHALNTFLLCAGTVVVYFFCRRWLLELTRSNPRRPPLSPRAAGILALLVAGIFATNRHVLETSLLIMSEPAFLLATCAWLALALRRPDWPSHPRQTAAMILLAILAWSLRGAGIVCVAATVLYAFGYRVRHARKADPAALTPARSRLFRFAPLILVLALPLAYQLLLAIYSPEKSLFSVQDSTHSYPQQLLRGILVEPAGLGDPHPWYTVTKAWFAHIYILVRSHFQDYAASFVPLPQEGGTEIIRNVLGKGFALLGLAGVLMHGVRHVRRLAPAAGMTPGGGLIELYILFYVALYLLWPFNFPRFWTPILPFMLVYAADVIMTLSHHVLRLWRKLRLPTRVMEGVTLSLRQAALIFLLSLLMLSLYAVSQIGQYARRLNHVSAALRDTVQAIIQMAPVGPNSPPTLVTGMSDEVELYALAWYFSQEPAGAGYHIGVPAKKERADNMLLRHADALRKPAPGRPEGAGNSANFYFFSYFPDGDTRDTLTSFQRQRPQDGVVKVFQSENLATVWEIRVKPASVEGSVVNP